MGVLELGPGMTVLGSHLEDSGASFLGTDDAFVSKQRESPASGNKRPDQSQEAPDTFICDQCRKIDYSKVIDHSMEDEAPWQLVAKRQGLHRDCALCTLFTETILPGTYDEIPYDSPWKLRAFRLKYMTVNNQDSYYFQGIPRAALYAGDSERDCFKYKDDERTERRGLLFIARTRDLRDYAAIAQAQQLPRTQFTPAEYDPDLVRHWMKLSSEDQDKASELEGGIQREGRPNYPLMHSDPVKHMKVIDCETFEIVKRTSEMEYLALSYVWQLANDEMVHLGCCAVEESSTAIFLPPEIPRVVHNAITVVRDLGYRYIWVDQYCIDQSGAEGHIKEQLSEMDLIYSSAKLTIIAASTQGALPGVGTTPRIPQEILDLQSGTGRNNDDVTFFTTNPSVGQAISTSMWFTRGWCFQEAILSHRRLYFTDHEAYFEAEGMWCSDSYPEPEFMDSHILYDIVRSELSLGVSSWEAFLDKRETRNSYDLDDPRGLFWAELEAYLVLLREYMEKKLTKDDDVINGFQGVIKLFSRQDANFQTLQGLPVLDLSGLFPNHYITSRSTDGKTMEESVEAYSTTEEQEQFRRFRNELFLNVLRWNIVSDHSERRLGFPSWSWAGWKARTNWVYKPENIYTHETEMGAPRLNIQAVEALSGRILDFDEAPSYFSEPTDDPMFLIGEATEVPISQLMLPRTWHELFTQSKLTKLREKAHSVKEWCSVCISPIWFRSRIINVSHEASIGKQRTLAKVFRLSRLAKCFNPNTWHICKWELDSQDVQGSFFQGEGEEEDVEIVRRLDDGRWSFLLLNERPGSADLLIVSWETDDECVPREHSGREPRTCSRVGYAEICNDSESGRLFSEGRQDLPSVHFRLG
ncbi:hypothetical protein DL764_008818 [Monosporascus ibericus]|uniref:Heterokaryon incompatibility domain-containing protein n=1 Tax=Monosporascus ibericus TaxID=155417 RepID=A0A4Q4SZK4_9PEZI|nr:hypothetical protein DL764_008818 [Monosporascus ibericus]